MKTSNSPKPTRTLRSKTPQKPTNPNLLVFDGIDPYVYNNKAFLISKKTSDKDLYHYSSDSELPKNTVPKSVQHVQEGQGLPRKTKFRADPLDDAVYASFHKTMTKREVSMVNDDKLKILSDVETLQSQRDSLNQPTWIKLLPSIVKINNISNTEEVIRKHTLALMEINKRIVQYQNWKKRLEELKQEIKYHAHSLKKKDPLKEYSTPPAALRKQRQDERREKYGTRIRLKLHNGYSIIIDPLTPPKLEKDGKTKRKKR